MIIAGGSNNLSTTSSKGPRPGKAFMHRSYARVQWLLEVAFNLFVRFASRISGGRCGHELNPATPLLELSRPAKSRSALYHKLVGRRIREEGLGQSNQGIQGSGKPFRHFLAV